jgi:preprotein translocase subunit SecD
MDNNAIISAVCINSETPGEYFVKLNFTDEGMTKFSEITEAISQKEDGKNYLTFTLDGEVIAKPKIDAAVNSESVNLDGDFTVESATLIANVLSGGELPIQLKIEE